MDYEELRLKKDMLLFLLHLGWVEFWDVFLRVMAWKMLKIFIIGHDDILAILPLLIKFWTPKIYLQHILHCNFLVVFRCLYVSFQRGSGSRNLWRGLLLLWLGGGETSIPAWVVEIAGRTNLKVFSSLPHFTIFTCVKKTPACEMEKSDLRTIWDSEGPGGCWFGIFVPYVFFCKVPQKTALDPLFSF